MSATALEIRDYGQMLHQARRRAGLSARQLAARAGTSHATVLAYEKGTKAPVITTFLRLLRACGFAVDVTLVARIREADGVPRGEELEQVLDLADQFPVRTQPGLSYPRFASSRDDPAH